MNEISDSIAIIMIILIVGSMLLISLTMYGYYEGNKSDYRYCLDECTDGRDCVNNIECAETCNKIYTEANK